MAALLEIRDLEVDLFTRRGVMRAIDRFSLTVEHGQTLGLVGESGCGKSMTSLAIMGLLPMPPAKVTGGAILLEGRDLIGLSDTRMQAVRGREIGIIFQDPMSSLNPVYTVGYQLTEVLRRHFKLDRRAADKRALELLDRVHIPDARRRFDAYPHELSGGMNQRVVIAMAIACEPKLLIADEPTTALDVTIQAQIIELLKDIQRESRMGMIFITHDLGVIADVADRVTVMYAGKKAEEAPVGLLFDDPRHPYTRGLIGATPKPGDERRRRLVEIPGTVPGLSDRPKGCAFANRCPLVFERCRVEHPALINQGAGHEAACFLATETEDYNVASVGA
ncbi:ABC transporter ATP-binding protein [Rhodopseudomonas sp. HC1]|uniref:ABC transporter ATP-binding protein n=1 Tax=Rhodopseudomonas infernalis TaxID=2897386 RepID=UPI001EE8420D|nr:ABC transporter ATP-binding protein [Rhodopseudomonas infernalis]MCG6205239.1 ABC transporter ATP-binding protein [Rhodopseudomonas infernalis]